MELDPAEVEFYLDLVVLVEQLLTHRLRLLQVGLMELVVVEEVMSILAAVFLPQVELVVQLEELVARVVLHLIQPLGVVVVVVGVLLAVLLLQVRLESKREETAVKLLNLTQIQ
jgi:hypothetical protein